MTASKGCTKMEAALLNRILPMLRHRTGISGQTTLLMTGRIFIFTKISYAPISNPARSYWNTLNIVSKCVVVQQNLTHDIGDKHLSVDVRKELKRMFLHTTAGELWPHQI